MVIVGLPPGSILLKTEELLLLFFMMLQFDWLKFHYGRCAGGSSISVFQLKAALIEGRKKEVQLWSEPQQNIFWLFVEDVEEFLPVDSVMML